MKTNKHITIISMFVLILALSFSQAFSEYTEYPPPEDTENTGISIINTNPSNTTKKIKPFDKKDTVKSPFKMQRACINKVPHSTRISNNWLRRDVDARASSANSNEVELSIFHSYVDNNQVHCQYRSQNRDIPNLVYRFPCRNAVKANNTDYPHAYVCAL